MMRDPAPAQPLAVIERLEAAHRRMVVACTLATLLALGVGGWLAFRFLSHTMLHLGASSVVRNLGAQVDEDWPGSDGGHGTSVSFAHPQTWMGVTDATVARLKEFDHLYSLNLSGCGRITEKGLAALADLPELEELFLDGTESPAPQVTDQTLDVLRHLRRLRTLSLAKTQITDAGIAKLVALQDLRFLDLEATQVSDASIPTLMKLPKLKDVILVQTNVTARGVTRLQLARPDIELVYDVSIDQLPARTAEAAAPAQEVEHDR
jgi:hypothetical protein